MITYPKELKSVGLNICGCDSNGRVDWVDTPNEPLAALVWAAHEQPLTSTECLALQAAITNEQWLAYCDVRKAPIRQQREQRYRSETDTLRMKADEDAYKNNTTPDLSTWVAAKDQIRSDLPYPE